MLSFPLLMDYLRKGGFPEIVWEESDEAVRDYVKSTVLERIVSQDIPQEFALKDVPLLKTLLGKLFCHRTKIAGNCSVEKQHMGSSEGTELSGSASKAP